MIEKARTDMTKSSAQAFPFAPYCDLNVLTGLLCSLLFTTVGCVTQSTYEAATTERDRFQAELERAQAEVKALEQQAESLQALNDQEDRRLKELLARLEAEKDAADRFQHEFRTRVTSLQAKLAALQNDQRALAREVIEAKKQRGALQALVARYQKELRTPEPASEPTPAQAPPQFEPGPLSGPAATAPPAATPPPETVAAAPSPPPQPPLQVQPSAQPAPPAQPQPPPAEADESWLSTILNWFSSLWD